MGRSLGVDVGTVRVGLAVSDPEATVATPIATVPAAADPLDLADAVAAVAAAHQADHVVVGLPRGMTGRDTASTARARAVAGALSSHGLHVDLWDERLSSAEAERLLVAAGRRRSQRRVERDPVAATIILQGWLDANRRPRE